MAYELEDYIPYISFTDKNTIKELRFTLDEDVVKLDTDTLLKIGWYHDKKINDDGTVIYHLLVNLNFFDFSFIFGELLNVYEVSKNGIDLGFTILKVDNKKFYKWIPKSFSHFYKFYRDLKYYLLIKGNDIFLDATKDTLSVQEQKRILYGINAFVEYCASSYLYALVEALPSEHPAKYIKEYIALVEKRKNAKRGAIYLKKYFNLFSSDIKKLIE